MRNHMTGRGFINLQVKGASTNFLEPRLNTSFVPVHCFSVLTPDCFRVMLGLTKATIIAPYKDLHLFATLPLSSKNVQIRITNHRIKRRFKLLTVANGTARPQIQWNGAGDRKTVANRGVNRGIDRSRPSAAGKPDHVEAAIFREMAGTAAALEVIQADRSRFEEVFNRTACSGELKHSVVAT